MVYLHDAQPFAIPRNFSFRFGTWYRLLFRLAARHAAGFVVNSEFTRNELSRYLSIPLDRMTLCPPGSEHVHEQSVPGPTHKEVESIPPGYLLAVSSVTPNKNFDAVTRALQILGADAPRCVIVGMRNSRVFGEVAFARERVSALGFVTDAALHTLYRNALALIFPSFYEGFGLPPLEAMALGCPVIVSNTAALPEVARDAALYCDPHDPVTIANAVRRLLAEPELFANLSEAGKRRAADFSWRSSALALVECLKRLNAAQDPASRRLEKLPCA
jgi:glycosyltransferase involved in cell wall biosynthesis